MGAAFAAVAVPVVFVSEGGYRKDIIGVSRVPRVQQYTQTSFHRVLCRSVRPARCRPVGARGVGRQQLPPPPPLAPSSRSPKATAVRACGRRRGAAARCNTTCARARERFLLTLILHGRTCSMALPVVCASGDGAGAKRARSAEVPPPIRGSQGTISQRRDPIPYPSSFRAARFREGCRHPARRMPVAANSKQHVQHTTSPHGTCRTARAPHEPLETHHLRPSTVRHQS